jgi:hypothetical protein
LDVIDTGVGIEPEALGKAVPPVPHYQAGRQRAGPRHARKVVVAHGGRIDVQSTPGRGTKFTITLPGRHARGVAAVKVAKAATVATHRGWRGRQLPWRGSPPKRGDLANSDAISVNQRLPF